MLRFMPHEAAGMYRNWEKQHTTALLLCPIPRSSFPFFSFFLTSPPLFFFYPFTFPPPFYVHSLRSLFKKPPQAGLLDRNKRPMSLFMWLRTSQATALAKEQPGTMETAWSRHRAGLMRKPPSCKKSLQEISSHAPLLYRQELWDYIFIPNPGWLYLTVRQTSCSCYFTALLLTTALLLE